MLKKYRKYLVLGFLLAVIIVSQIPKTNEFFVAGDEDVDITPFRSVYYLNGDEDVSITPM